jgi:putative tricarboxylic transport membrane protein
VIALVLGPLAEETLRQSLIISAGGLSIFYTRSMSLLLLLIIIGLLIAAPLALSIYRRRSTRDDR